MDKQISNEYSPDYVSPPGDTLQDVIDALGMSQAELARRMGTSPEVINRIIKAENPITENTAMSLQRTVGVPGSFWLNRQSRYDMYLAQEVETVRLKENLKWLKRFPVNEMVTRGWLKRRSSKVDQMKELLEFFGVASPDVWRIYYGQLEAAFRKPKPRKWSLEALVAWLRKGELEAQRIVCQKYNQQAFRTRVYDLRRLTVKPLKNVYQEIVSGCALCGVVVVIVEELPKAGVSGATRWLAPKKALVQLSTRYKTEDQFWFTFFHEAAHVLEKGAKRSIILDGDDCGKKNGDSAANEFAANLLIPKKHLTRFLRNVTPPYISERAVRKFARELAIHPGIVVGRLQRMKAIPYTHFKKLRRNVELN